MFDKQGGQNLFKQLDNLYIQPEIKERKEKNKLKDDFKILRCLIKLPKNHKPIIEFNDEIKWNAKVKPVKTKSFKKDDPVYLSDIDKIEKVLYPKHDNKKVAFFYIFWTGFDYRIIFDCSPNLPDFKDEIIDDYEWNFSKIIAQSLNDILNEYSIKEYEKSKDDLKKIGLWAVPSLIPNPLSLIIKEVQQQNIKNAKNVFINHCDVDFLTSLVTNWTKIDCFKERKTIFIDALSVHKDKKYTLSIPTLIPQVEGIITDWLYIENINGQIPFKQKSKTLKFKDILTDNPKNTFVIQKIIDSFIEFSTNGPFYETYSWSDNVNNSFPNRHIIGHGKYDPDLYTEENSIKVFLFLDTIYDLLIKRNLNK